jgi:UrcA family protein
MLKIIPALLLAAGLPGIALAQEVPADVRVSYHDLDLHTPAGVRALDLRLARAIYKVCPDDAGAVVPVKIAAERCRKAKRAEVGSQRDAVLAKISQDGVAVASTH